MMELPQEIICSLWVTDSGRILEDWADNGFICRFFGLLVSDLYVSSEEADCLVCFVGDDVYVKFVCLL